VGLGKGFWVGEEGIQIRVGSFEISKMAALEDFENSNSSD
jgi:hypothetical protein